MKVLMLTTATSLMDGINRHILTIARALHKVSNCKIAVCTVFPEGDLNKALKDAGVTCFSLNARSGHDFRVLLAFYKLMRTYQPDVVHCHVMALFERVVAAICFRNKKYITTVHGISDDEGILSVKRLMESFLHRIFYLPNSYILYVSAGVRNFFLNKKSFEVSEVCYNPVTFSEFCSHSSCFRKELNLPETTPLVGTVCRLAEVKNPEAFTSVMCQVLKMSQQTHAVVIGDGDESLKVKLGAIVEQFELNDRFHWLGYRSDASKIVNELNCFVMTSYREGFPTSILEAIASHTPFAMMEGEGGLKDIMELHRTEGPLGIIVPQGDIEGMSQGICKIIADSDFANSLSSKAYDVGRRLFDVTSVSERLCNIYQSLCAQ